MSGEALVIDASALIDLLIASELADAVAGRIGSAPLHAPGHLDAEVLSALGRLHRAGAITARAVRQRLAELADAPIARHEVGGLLVGAWGRRQRLRLADALYVELAEQLTATLVTTDEALGRAVAIAEVIEA